MIKDLLNEKEKNEIKIKWFSHYRIVETHKEGYIRYIIYIKYIGIYIKYILFLLTLKK